MWDAYRPVTVHNRLAGSLEQDGQLAAVSGRGVGSAHSRGCAVDLWVFALNDGNEYPHPDDRRDCPPGAADVERANWMKDNLHRIMGEHNFEPDPEGRWWHFTHRHWRAYPLVDLNYHELVLPSAAEPPPDRNAQRGGDGVTHQPGKDGG